MIVVFDTETADFPRKSGYKPTMMQLAYAIFDADGNHVHSHCTYVKPPEGGFVISEGAFKAHGITNEVCENDGQPIGHVLETFCRWLEKATHVVAHNIEFDSAVLVLELTEHKIRPNTKGYAKVDTMKPMTDIVKAPSPRGFGFKWPSLQELHTFCFGSGFDGAHDALVDVNATAKCYFELRKMGHVK